MCFTSRPPAFHFISNIWQAPREQNVDNTAQHSAILPVRGRGTLEREGFFE